MKINPELRRYLWLDFSALRLVALPALIAVAVASWMSWQAHGLAAEADFKALHGVALFACMFLTVGWGGGAASQALSQDVREGTWDFQRLSSLSPIELAYGKLIGCTLYSWYGAVLALAVCACAELMYDSPQDTFRRLGIVLILGLLAQSVLFFYSMYALPTSSDQRSRTAQRLIMLPVTLAALLAYATISGFDNSIYQEKFLVWYGHAIASESFAFNTCLSLLCWVCVGIYARMRTQLQMSRMPFLWPLFVLYVLGIAGGFPGSIVWISIALVYLSAFGESWNGMTYRRVQAYAAAGDMKRVLLTLPNWIYAAVIAVVVCLTSFSVVSIALLCMLVRDIGILHYCTFAPLRKKALINTMLWLLVLYLFFPAFGALRPMFAESWMYSVSGNVPVSDPTIAFSAAVQAVIVGYLVLRRWRVTRHAKS